MNKIGVKKTDTRYIRLDNNIITDISNPNKYI